MDTNTFLSALLAIVVIDIVLAGDNAIVIALAARSLPDHLRKRAIIWGTAGAIVVRMLMTAVVVWLLKIPGLLLVGGALLVWIAYKLIVPKDDAGDAHGVGATTFWGAMQTIVIADAVMGLDNVLAVAGAAHGSYTLVVLGLLISIPIVVWGSTLVLKIVDKYPSVTYVGAAVLLWTAAKMMSTEPLVVGWLQGTPWLSWAFYAVVPATLGLGWWANQCKVAVRVASRVVSSTPPTEELSPSSHQSSRQLQPENPMSANTAFASSNIPEERVSEPSNRSAGPRLLVPVDGTASAMLAVRHAIAEVQRGAFAHIDVVNVQPDVGHRIGRFVSRSNREAWRRERSDKATAQARALLAHANVPHAVHRVKGQRAEQIARMAATLSAEQILVGTARHRSITRMLEDSLTDGILDHATVPVKLVVGDAAPTWERYGIPATVASVASALLVAAMD